MHVYRWGADGPKQRCRDYGRSLGTCGCEYAVRVSTSVLFFLGLTTFYPTHQRQLGTNRKRRLRFTAGPSYLCRYVHPAPGAPRYCNCSTREETPTPKVGGRNRKQLQAQVVGAWMFIACTNSLERLTQVAIHTCVPKCQRDASQGVVFFFSLFYSFLLSFSSQKGGGKPVIRTEMKNVTYFHSDTKDKKVFAYKSTGGDKNPLVQMCHVFKAPSKSKVGIVTCISPTTRTTSAYSHDHCAGMPRACGFRWCRRA